MLNFQSTLYEFKNPTTNNMNYILFAIIWCMIISTGSSITLAQEIHSADYQCQTHHKDQELNRTICKTSPQQNSPRDQDYCEKNTPRHLTTSTKTASHTTLITYPTKAISLPFDAGGWLTMTNLPLRTSAGKETSPPIDAGHQPITMRALRMGKKSAVELKEIEELRQLNKKKNVVE